LRPAFADFFFNLPDPGHQLLLERVHPGFLFIHESAHQIIWQQTINQLAEDFRMGKADVDPKKLNTCETSYCELSGLCRIDELRAGVSEDE